MYCRDRHGPQLARTSNSPTSHHSENLMPQALLLTRFSCLILPVAWPHHHHRWSIRSLCWQPSSQKRKKLSRKTSTKELVQDQRSLLSKFMHLVQCPALKRGLFQLFTGILHCHAVSCQLEPHVMDSRCLTLLA